MLNNFNVDFFSLVCFVWRRFMEIKICSMADSISLFLFQGRHIYMVSKAIKIWRETYVCVHGWRFFGFKFISSVMEDWKFDNIFRYDFLFLFVIGRHNWQHLVFNLKCLFESNHKTHQWKSIWQWMIFLYTLERARKKWTKKQRNG